MDVSLQFNPLLTWFVEIPSQLFLSSVGCVYLDIEVCQIATFFLVQKTTKSQQFIREVEIATPSL